MGLDVASCGCFDCWIAMLCVGGVGHGMVLPMHLVFAPGSLALINPLYIDPYKI